MSISAIILCNVTIFILRQLFEIVRCSPLGSGLQNFRYRLSLQSKLRTDILNLWLLQEEYSTIEIASTFFKYLGIRKRNSYKKCVIVADISEVKPRPGDDDTEEFLPS